MRQVRACVRYLTDLRDPCGESTLQKWEPPDSHNLPEEHIMVNTSRPDDDAIVPDEPDTEGHLSVLGDDEPDTEGHFAL
jgi:hypothetical protein